MLTFQKGDRAMSGQREYWLRSPPLKRRGVPVQLPLNRFHLRDHRFPDEAVPGRLPRVEQLRLPWHLDSHHQGQSFD
jgi:hypothetical protein